jgi:hypothetical protein
MKHLHAFLFAAICLAPLMIGAQPAQAVFCLTVEIDGGIAPLTRDELRGRLERELAADGVAAMDCRSDEPPTPAEDRIEWSFRPLPSAAGAVRYLGPGSTGTITPPSLSRPIAIEARLVIGGRMMDAVQATASVNGLVSPDATLNPIFSTTARRFAQDIQAGSKVEGR